MTISVLIPTYNYKCFALVSAIRNQLVAAGVDFEIIVAEDGGKDQVVAISNHRINDLPHCKYIRCKENKGRSAIRNFLAAQATGDWLMFVDSDGVVVRDDFVQKYIAAIGSGSAVICGGIIQPEKCPSEEQSLRWMYERNYESNHGFVGNQFRSFCFMIRKDVFMLIKFDERYRMYGWEDVQFGVELSKRGYKVYAIDNPLMNGDIETNERFLSKTEEGLRSLKQHSAELYDNVTLLRWVTKLKSHHLLWFAKCSLGLLLPVLRHHLSGRKPNVKLFGVYKLGYYLNLN